MMQRRKRYFAAALVAGAGALALAGQNTVGQTPDDEAKVDIRVGVSNVLAPTIVLDKDGGYVVGIKPSEFRLYDNDKLQDIKVDEIYAPISLVVAVQADAKVENALPKIKKIGTILQSVVAGEQGEVAVVAFDHRIQKLQDFTTDPDKISEGLQQLKVGSTTSVLTDTVVEATRMLRNRPPNRRKILLLISETRDKGSAQRPREALTNLEIGNVMVYSVNMSRFVNEFTSTAPPPRADPIPPAARHVPAGGVQTPTTTAQMTGSSGYGADFAPLVTEIMRSVKAVFVPNPVEIFTRYTGGKEYAFVSQQDLERALGDVSREIHNQYLITYNPNNKLEGGFHKIRVEVARRGLEVRTRDGYWLAAMP
jgi:VWFA-related protein